MSVPQPLVPPEIAARSHAHGRLGIAFGPRFFVGLLLGFLWLVPAWWVPRLIPAMFLWDLLVLAAFVVDVGRLPKPAELEGRRQWEHAPSLATTSRITLVLRNFGAASIRCNLVDETPSVFRKLPPSLELAVAPRASSEICYLILPRARGDVHVGRLFLRYQSLLGLAERWAVVEIPQTVRVLPDLEQARQHALYLIRSRQVEMERRRRRQRGHGREFESLRDYRQGDEMRDICWTATARRHQLTTRIFEIERSQVVWVVLDAGRLLRAEIQLPGSSLRLAKLDFAVNADFPSLKSPSSAAIVSAYLLMAVTSNPTFLPVAGLSIFALLWIASRRSTRSPPKPTIPAQPVFSSVNKVAAVWLFGSLILPKLPLLLK